MDLMSMAELLGNFGKFIGAFAVVATLVFVGIQVRQSRIAMNENNKFASIASRDESRRAFSSWRARFVENPDVAALWLAGLAGEELDAPQKFRFRQLLEERQFLFNTAYDRYIAHDMQERAEAMARALALLISDNPSMPKLGWLPGTEMFRREVEAQLPPDSQ